ncbi:hypothetical protein DY000_02037267 [Brassica cretica]|uniref:BHLH domain-containing protein n=2 Tax=Brassica cretica TaxID=69181 RepID=A0ABQ7B589_BRACR|nr:hypothetical protein DY000_02037267 [Brassica cretica]
MLELEGVSQQIATASLKECYYLQRTDLVRREKISEMLTLLQDLLLYMKLATINPRMESNRNAALSIKVKENMLYAIACSEQRLPLGYYSLAQNMPRFSDTQFLSNYGFVQTKVSGGIVKSKRSKHEEAGSSKNLIEKCDDKYTNKDATKPPEPPKDYIHVRARRGHPADSHRLAERVLLPSENRFVFFFSVSIFLFNFEMLMFVFGYHVRREKISEMLTLLQDLVPGSSRITGKAVSLDEIINYVQSLERQVELLYMKLATINPRMESNRNAALSINVKENMLYAIACSEQRLPLGYYSLAQNMPRFSDTRFLSNYGFVQTKLLYMKLATINPRMESNRNAALSIKVKENMLYAIACSEQRLPLGYYSLAQNMPRFSDTQFLSNYGFVQTKIWILGK